MTKPNPLFSWLTAFLIPLTLIFVIIALHQVRIFVESCDTPIDQCYMERKS